MDYTFIRRIPITETYTLNGLYPNTLYYIWLAARSQRGEGATTPPIAVRTKQYGMTSQELSKCSKSMGEDTSVRGDRIRMYWSFRLCNSNIRLEGPNA